MAFEPKTNIHTAQGKSHTLFQAQVDILFLESNRPDIVLLTEIKLKPIHKRLFEGYNMIRNYRLTDGGGGTAILIWTHIQFESINTPPNINNIEMTIIKIPI